ncbi:ATP-binding protein [Neotamlana laminarinivorans]|uniref:ATP-binding protein n=1 Tax=Neotamlana laminarinivorans TaxID=2883124 RepID=A0A9X1I267_9FLAO|nr:ATP-binding protein [Tamlana laminarinivorans]MCB4800026.1 ATP-binding protein [Tamlana laminarinivorans]
MRIVNTKIKSEDASPNPEYLIKSIAEQGYSLETSLADLMDNSISAEANKIEVLIDTDSEPFKLFLADNGQGMTEEELSSNMQFPSNSPEDSRSNSDLGRFGLGMKTASFSQTRKFTVLSKKKGDNKYYGRTWDVDFLKANGWKIIINSDEEVARLMYQYNQLSKEFLKRFDDYEPNTIVIWEGLYKFESYLKEGNRKEALKKEITEVTSDYLALVFHRFMEKDNNPLKIRINNTIVSPFNPFPEEEKDFRQIEPKQSSFRSDVIKIEGFVLPSRAITESKKGLTKWTTTYRGLMDMEGLYIYRANRIILFGGWNGIVKKAPRLQLARLRVEVGNSVDHLLHLNVAKSQIVVPHELRNAFEDYIGELKIEAEREYYNRGIRKFSGTKTQNHVQLFERGYSNKGSILEVNNNFPLVRNLKDSLDKKQKSQLNLLLRMINTRVNNIRHVHEEKEFMGIEEKDGISLEELYNNILELLTSGISKEMIKEEIIPHLGFKYASLPDVIKSIFK